MASGDSKPPHFLAPKDRMQSIFFSPRMRTLKDDDLQTELRNVESGMTAIICTIGPKCNNVPMLAKMINEGMTIARLNFSHGTHEYHKSSIDNVRAAMAQNKKSLVAIMLDTKGPEIRTGKLKSSEPVLLTEGQEFRWHNDESLKDAGDQHQMYCTYKELSTTVKPGSIILCSDALLSFTVKEIKGTDVHCVVNNTGMLGSTKNMNLPGCKVTLPALTEKDKEDLQFGIENDIDIIAASFIRKAADVEEIRKFPGVVEKRIAIIAKIENQEGLDNFDEILKVVDGIMVARGDLGSEIPLEDVCTAQKMMISKCNIAGKPVITATQMMESMIQNPRPTRAEATDVANAVYDGTDCVMLSGETANGAYPVEAVRVMSRICESAEQQIDHREVYKKMLKHIVPPLTLTESLCSSAVKTAWDLQAALIVSITETGQSARLVSKYRPGVPILCLTPSIKTAHTIILSKGTIPYVYTGQSTNQELINRAINKAKEIGLLKSNDTVVVVFGQRERVSGSTNSITVVKVE